MRLHRSWQLAAVLVLVALDVAPARSQDALPPPPPEPPPLLPELTNLDPPREVCVWGELTFRGYALGDQIAPNGQEFKALFRVDMDFNLMLCRSKGLYLFADTAFWGQRAAPGITNPSQGPLDFSKREFDLTGGLAWNYASFWELRGFAYSFNNLNRGNSATRPAGFNDGVGLENRYYLSRTYADLGTEAFDVARATFLSVGYYPTKELVDSVGETFKPGPFARAYLTLDLLGEACYLYADTQVIATSSWTPRLVDLDAGVAFRPWSFLTPRLEFRIGSGDLFDLRNHTQEVTVYGAVRVVY